MEKEKCMKDFEDKKLKMSDEKCRKCPFKYSCVYIVMNMHGVINGDG